MPTLENLTLADVKNALQASSLRLGRKYLPYIQNAAREGQTLTARVSGGHLYRVEIELSPDSINSRCTCSWGGNCKHVGAVLLQWLEMPKSFVIKQAEGAALPAPGTMPLPVIPVAPPQTQKPKALPPWLAEPFATRQQQDQTTLAGWLEQIKLQDLRELARKRGWTVKGTSKAGLVQQISEYIIRPDELAKAVSSLDGEHRQVLQALVLLGHDQGIQPADIERVAESWGKLKRYKQITTYTSHLYEAGLALPGDLNSYSTVNDFIPRAMARVLLPTLFDVVPSTSHRPPDLEADELRLVDPYALVAAANQVALLLEQTSPLLRPPMPRPRLERFHPTLADWDYDPLEIKEAEKNRQLAASADLALTVPPPAWSLPDDVVARLAPIAGGESRLEFIFTLLVATGRFQPGSPVTAWPEVKQQYLRQPEAAQRAIFARTYFQMANWSELWDILRTLPDLKLKRLARYIYVKPEHLRPTLTRFRRQVIRLLACLPDNRWIALADLLPLLRAVWVRFDSQAWPPPGYYGPKPVWFLTWRGRELKPANDQDWQIAQLRFIKYMLTGPLHWLGLADVNLHKGVPVAIRLHGLADLYWDLVETPALPPVTPASVVAAQPPEVVSIDEDRIVVAPAAISAQAHSLLGCIARLGEAVPGRFVYHLDSATVHQSFEQGLTLADILADWERLLGLPMPEASRTRLEAWWQGYGQVRIYKDVTVIEFSDDYALAEMKAVTSLEKYLLAEISPRLVMIPKEAVGPLTAELEKAGYTPKQTEDVS